jgi:hypothetical protein
MFLSNTAHGAQEKLREESTDQGEAGEKSRCREKAGEDDCSQAEESGSSAENGTGTEGRATPGTEGTARSNT